MGGDDPEVLLRLCHRLLSDGQYGRALALNRHYFAIRNRDPAWTDRGDAEADLARVVRLTALEAKRPEILSSRLRPSSRQEGIDFGFVCWHRRHVLRAARLFHEWLDAPGDGARILDHVNAGCLAVLAAASRGEDAAPLGEAERVAWRKRGIDRFRAVLRWWARDIEARGAEARRWIREMKRHGDIGGVRGEAALAKLPEAERAAWLALWKKAEELLVR
jgi:hypothetical protein